MSEARVLRLDAADQIVAVLKSRPGKKAPDVHMKDAGDVGKHARRDPVGTFFIFLYLLKAHTYAGTKVGLR